VRKQWPLKLIVGAFAALICIAAFPFVEHALHHWRVAAAPEPRFKGHAIRTWLATIHGEELGQLENAHAAIREWGTNPIPLLVDWLRLNEKGPSDFDWRQKLNGWLGKQSLIEFRLPVSRPSLGLVLENRPPNRTVMAAEVFAEIGPTDQAAMSSLVLLLDEKEEEVARIAGDLLAGMAPDSVPTLITAVAAGPNRARIRAAAVLGQIGMPATAAIPALKRILVSRPLPVRLAAACTLVKLEDDPAGVIPVLIATVRGGDKVLRSQAFATLAGLGTQAKLATPQLRTILIETQLADVRRDTLWALHQIDPQQLEMMPIDSCSPQLSAAIADFRGLISVGAPPAGDRDRLKEAPRQPVAGQ
jgi:hypothetical protein